MEHSAAVHHEDYVTLLSYSAHVSKTNALKDNALDYALIGLFGEVGSLMEAAKKVQREGSAYNWFRKDALEEFGDALWYLTLLCELLGIDVTGLFRQAVQHDAYALSVVPTGRIGAPVALLPERSAVPVFLDSIIHLGQAATTLFDVRTSTTNAETLLLNLVIRFLDALHASELSLADVMRGNVEKSASRFLKGDILTLPQFDLDFGPDERLPDKFDIAITKRPDGRAVLKWNGVFIGDPLTDNIIEKDGYRYHDVFHLSHAAILGWSPVFRSLIKHKRKTQPAVDEAQDGGRAIVIEEGLTAWIFSRSKDFALFSQVDRLPYDILKIIQQFVDGYEVSACPLWLWEEAIIRGYDVFRQVVANDGGIVTGNRLNRTIAYRPLSQP